VDPLQWWVWTIKDYLLPACYTQWGPQTHLTCFWKAQFQFPSVHNFQESVQLLGFFVLSLLWIVSKIVLEWVMSFYFSVCVCVSLSTQWSLNPNWPRVSNHAPKRTFNMHHTHEKWDIIVREKLGGVQLWKCSHGSQWNKASNPLTCYPFERGMACFF
jgi:hypothetical protein